MNYKVSPVIIITLAIVIIAVVILGISLFSDNSKKKEQENVIKTEMEMVPKLDLSLDTEEENQEKVIIKAVATTEDSNGIYSITLPDGSTKRLDEVSYTVTKNGNYTFKANGNNGKTSSLTIEVNNIRELSSSNPYLPDGFSYVEGEVESGYVIEDSYGNQFVWVPVEDGKMIRNTMLESDYEESNNTASALTNSVAQNYGFYISRYEACKLEVDGNLVAGSVKDRTPWTNVDYNTALNASAKMASAFGYEGYQTSLMNSWAWDTTTTWIDKSVENYSTNTGYGNYSGNIKNTGMTESDMLNNICDLAGNVREWTTEIYKQKPVTTNTSKKNSKNKNVTNQEIVSETVTYRVIRGGSANVSRTASSHTGYKETMTDAYWGFRTILYK